MRNSIWAVGRFGALAVMAYGAAGPAAGIAGALLGVRSIPVWFYGATLSGLLLLATWIALRLDGGRLAWLGLTPTRTRLRQFAIGFGLSALFYAALHLVRAASVGASWTRTDASIFTTAAPGLAIALLLMLPEELLFRGYAFRRAGEVIGNRATLVISSTLFGLYHLPGSGTWGMGAFFTFMMPALGGVLFALAAQRTGGLALPIGLHLGGNWIQGSVLAFQLEGQPVFSAVVWRAELSRAQFTVLTAPDLPDHLPFLTMLLFMAISMSFLFRPETNLERRLRPRT